MVPTVKTVKMDDAPMRHIDRDFFFQNQKICQMDLLEASEVFCSISVR